MMKEQSEPKKRAAVAFAKDIASRITDAVRDGVCDEVVLIAAPHILGVLRGTLEKTGNVIPSGRISGT